MTHNAFTTRYPNRMNVLRTEISVFLPTTNKSIDLTKLKKYLAIWDTGASGSVITKKVAQEIGLVATGMTEVCHAGGKSTVPTYFISIILPSGVVVENVRVTEAELDINTMIPEEKRTHALIGMDIISLGDLAITNHNNKTTMFFKIPPTREIDFIPECVEHNTMTDGNREAKRNLQKQLKRRI